jgi:hypothetical protein
MGATECNAIRNGLLGGNALGFLSNNVIFTSTADITGIPSSATKSFDFDDDGPTVQGGRQYGAITPENPNLINGLLDVAYLPWGHNAGYYIILEPTGGPNIMMTATMNGCSVGYVRGPGGIVRVSHHNLSGSSNMDTEQRTTLSFATGALHPSAYRHGSSGFDSKTGEIYFKQEGFGFVFGVRQNQQWTMYAQMVTSRRETLWRQNKVTLNEMSVTSAAVF